MENHMLKCESWEEVMALAEQEVTKAVEQNIFGLIVKKTDKYSVAFVNKQPQKPKTKEIPSKIATKRKRKRNDTDEKHKINKLETKRLRKK